MSTGYSIAQYARMVNCAPRMAAYRSALERAITPGCTVIDIGAGFGICSLLACQLGAGRVVAIEPDDSIQLLRSFAHANDWSDRITIVQDVSSNYVPDQLADVIVSDLRGSLPLFEGHIEAIKDARNRLLTPGGVLIPERDTIKAALAFDQDIQLVCNEPWRTNVLGLNLELGRSFCANQLSRVSLKREKLLSSPKVLGVVDYTTVTSPDWEADIELVAECQGAVNGVILWFDADLLPGIGFSNEPGCPELVYGQTIFPLDESIALTAGDRLRFKIKAQMIDGAYVWSWMSTLLQAGQAEPSVYFRQSSFLSRVISPSRIETRSDSFVPQASTEKTLDQFCLSLIDGNLTAGEIAGCLEARYPESFTEKRTARDHVAGLLSRYSSISE